MQIVRSHALATAAGDVTVAAPAATSGSSLLGSMSCTTSEKPAFARLCAIGPPILPSPMNPTLPGIAFPPRLLSRLSLLHRRPQIAARLIGPHQQRGDDVVDLRRADGTAILAANAGMDHVNMPEFPRRTALFERDAIVLAERESHAGQITAFDEIAPAAAVSRHLVHVREFLAQIAVAGLRGAAFVLRTDGADEIGIDDDDVRFDRQNPKSRHDQIVGHLAVRHVGRPVVTREPDPGETQLGTGFAAGPPAGGYSRGAAGDVRPLVLLDPGAAAIGVP